MKKLHFYVTICLSTIILHSCIKINEFDTPESSNFAAEAKTWFFSNFTNTSEYKKGTSHGEIKLPNWNYGKVYKLGELDVAEFPLISNKKKVYITEKLSDADAKRVVNATNFKVLFIKSPSKGIEVRIIEFIPTLEYLKLKKFNINDLSFKDYQKEFKGSFFMFDYNENLLKGYSYTNKGIRTLKFNYLGENSGNSESMQSNTNDESTESLCDNIPDPDPNCQYEVTTIYEIECNGQWSANEGFNPLYCTLNVVSITCEVVSCDGTGGPDPMQECLEAGNSAEECLCTVYGMGCGGGGGTGGNGGNNQCEEYEQTAEAFLSAGQGVISGASTVSNGNPPAAGDWDVQYEWQIFHALTWELISHETGHLRRVNYPNTSRWEFRSPDGMTHSSVSEQGINVGGTRDWTVDNNSFNFTAARTAAYQTISFTVNSHVLGLPNCPKIFPPRSKSFNSNAIHYAP
jgi:hypothetical protein